MATSKIALMLGAVAVVLLFLMWRQGVERTKQTQRADCRLGASNRAAVAMCLQERHDWHGDNAWSEGLK